MDTIRSLAVQCFDSDEDDWFRNNIVDIMDNSGIVEVKGDGKCGFHVVVKIINVETLDKNVEDEYIKNLEEVVRKKEWLSSDEVMGLFNHCERNAVLISYVDENSVTIDYLTKHFTSDVYIVVLYNNHYYLLKEKGKNNFPKLSMNNNIFFINHN